MEEMCDRELLGIGMVKVQMKAKFSERNEMKLMSQIGFCRLLSNGRIRTRMEGF
jgi:hypothetical protein